VSAQENVRTAPADGQLDLARRTGMSSVQEWLSANETEKHAALDAR
jgi:hypothetical protein